MPRVVMADAVDEPPGLVGTDMPPQGTIFICAACGKRSRTRFGFDGQNLRVGPSQGWDESCMLNAVLVQEDSIVFAEED